MFAEEKTWKLAAPDWSSLDTIWRHPLPFVLWPVGNQPLLAHWMDESVRQGIAHIEIFVADRPAEVRQWLEGGVYWSRQVKVTPVANEQGMPQNCQRLDRLPSEPDAVTAPADAAALLRHWFSMQKHWLQHRLDELPSIDARHDSGGWAAPGAMVAPSAQLIAPFWVGEDARIGAGCRIGPNAFIGRHAIIDANVEVEEAYVAEGTYVGKFTRVAQAVATGKVLVDIRRGVRLELAEHFILSPVRVRGSRPKLAGRLGALLCSVSLAPLALLRNAGAGDWTEQHVTTCAGDTIQLRTGRRGPLWMRRWPWFRHIAAGRLRWFGALPRGESDFERMPKELAAQVRSARAGMFSLADLNHCDGTADPDEWLHATYQVQGVDPSIPQRLLRNLWKIAWSQPVAARGGETPP